MPIVLLYFIIFPTKYTSHQNENEKKLTIDFKKQKEELI